MGKFSCLFQPEKQVFPKSGYVIYTFRDNNSSGRQITAFISKEAGVIKLARSYSEPGVT